MDFFESSERYSKVFVHCGKFPCGNKFVALVLVLPSTCSPRIQEVCELFMRDLCKFTSEGSGSFDFLPRTVPFHQEEKENEESTDNYD